MKKNPLNFGLAFGYTCALFLFFIGILAWLSRFGDAIVELLRYFFIGYKDNLIGSIFGAMWGFLAGFIFGFLVAWFYNMLQKK